MTVSLSLKLMGSILGWDLHPSFSFSGCCVILLTNQKPTEKDLVGGGNKMELYYNSLLHDTAHSLSFEVEMKRPTEGAPALSIPWRTSLDMHWITSYTLYTLWTTTTTYFHFTRASPVSVASSGSFKRVFKWKVHKAPLSPANDSSNSGNEVLWRITLHLLQVIEPEQREKEQILSLSLSLSLSPISKNTPTPHSEVWCAFVREITSKTKKVLRRKKSVRLR